MKGEEGDWVSGGEGRVGVDCLNSSWTGMCVQLVTTEQSLDVHPRKIIMKVHNFI